MKMQVRLDEAFEACSALNLTQVKLGGYLIVLNSDFDVVLCEEPYVALMLLLNVDSGKFIARIWNETVTVGKIANAEQFIEVVRNFFSSGKPCVGLIEYEPPENERAYLTSYAPIHRKVSKTCNKIIDVSHDREVITCAECQKLSNLGSLHDVEVETTPNNCAVSAVKEETDDTCADIWEEGAYCENDPDIKSAIENSPSEDKTVLQANSSQGIENEEENVITSKRETEFVQAAVLESCIKSDPSPNSKTTKTFKEKETNDVSINSKYTLIPRDHLPGSMVQFNEYTGTSKEFWRENFVKETLKVSIIRKTILH